MSALLRIAVALFVFVALGAPLPRPAGAADEVAVEGRVTAIASSIFIEAGQVPAPPSVSLQLETAEAPIIVELAPGAEVRGRDGQPLAPHALWPDDIVRAVGTWQTATRFLAERIEVVGP